MNKEPKLTRSYIDGKGVLRKYYDFKETENKGPCKVTMGYTHRTYNDQEEVTNEIPVIEVDSNINADWNSLYYMAKRWEIKSLKVEVTSDDIWRDIEEDCPGNIQNPENPNPYEKR